MITTSTRPSTMRRSAPLSARARPATARRGISLVMVLDDYDIFQAVNYATFVSFIGAGQTCVCASRHIVQARVYDEFVEKLRAKTKTIRIGDPFDPATQLGPVISARQADRVLTYSRFGREGGAGPVRGRGG